MTFRLYPMSTASGVIVKYPPLNSSKMATVNGQETEAAKKILTLVNELSLGVVFKHGDFEMSKFKSGFISEIYLVTFKTIKPPVPQSIVVKFFTISPPSPDVKPDDKPGPGYEIINSQLNCLFIAQAGLGPQILLVKPDAIIMEHISGEQLTGEDDANPAICEDIARKLARLHSLSVPIARNNHLRPIYRMFHVWLTQELSDSVNSSLRPALERLGLPHLLKSNVRAEAFLIEDAIKATEPTATIVFSHRDFNHLNLLVNQDPITQSPTVKFIDFDFSGYHFRGTDLGRYFVDCKQPEQFHSNSLVPDQEILQFLAWYREECSNIHGADWLEDAKNSADVLLKEAKLFALLAYLIDIIFCIWKAHDCGIGKAEEERDEAKMDEFLVLGDKRYAGYLRTKARFLKDGLIL